MGRRKKRIGLREHDYCDTLRIQIMYLITIEVYIEASMNVLHFYNQVRRNAKVAANLT